MSAENIQSESNSNIKKQNFDKSQPRKIISHNNSTVVLSAMSDKMVDDSLLKFYNPKQASLITADANSNANVIANTVGSTSRPKLQVSRGLPQKQQPGSLPCPRKISVNNNPRFAGCRLIGLGGQPLDAHDGIGQDGIPKYKRPPHTYPALIASAILDSQHHVVTLRGIYDYIINNVPYYKWCHKMSAWQNSIRHNLSLDKCFVKGL